MASRGLSPTTALRVIAEGTAQEVVVDAKMILEMVMGALGARQMPFFSEVPCGANGRKVLIKLDVSSTMHHESGFAYVEGSPSTDYLVAEQSAMKSEIRYLNDTHRIHILDYSSQIAHDLDVNSMFKKLSAAISSVKRVIHQWELSVGKIKAVGITLEEKDASDKVAQEYERWERYASMKDYIDKLVQLYDTKIAESNSKADELDLCLSNYQKKYQQRQEAILSKGYIQTVLLQLKWILDYVLNYLGSPNADYSNTPTKGDMMKGIAKFYISPLPGIKDCGNIEVPGKDKHSIPAEQKATYESLIFMEKRYKLRIVDFNHPDRLYTELQHKDLVLVLDQILFLSNKVNKYWQSMIRDLKCHSDSYSMEPLSVYPGTADKDKIEAYIFCGNEATHLASSASKIFESCARLFREMEAMQDMVNAMKMAF